MDLKDVHDIILTYLSKAEAQHISHPEIDAFLDRAQIQHMDHIKPAYAANQQLHDALLPFKAKYVFTNSNTVDGLITLPYDYQHLLSIRTSVMDGTHLLHPLVQIVHEDHDFMDSQLIPVNVKNPRGLMEAGNKIQLYPEQPSAGTVYYLRRPLAPKFVYTMNVRQMVYDEYASVQLEWNEPSIEKIVMITLQMIGIPLNDDRIVQFGNAKEGNNG